MTMQYSSSIDVDNLFATTIIPVLSDTLQIAAAQNLKRGSLVDATGTLCASDAEVYAVLAEDCDTTAGAREAAVYLTGEFNEKALIVAGGEAVADYKQSARKVSIYIKPCM